MDYISPAIRDDFAAVNRLVIERLHSEVALVESIGQYIVEGGGKRMRPLITLLCARALGYAGQAARGTGRGHRVPAHGHAAAR